MLQIILALILLIYWLVFYIFVLNDLYLSHQFLGMILRVFFPIAILINIICTIYAIFLLAKKKGRKFRNFAALILNIVPILGVIFFLSWLFFGIKI